jgi:hypothetical protein
VALLGAEVVGQMIPVPGRSQSSGPEPRSVDIASSRLFLAVGLR